MKTNELFEHQKKAVEELRTGSILNGGVGSGKTLTALEYYRLKIPPWKSLYIITTAKKRDSFDWEQECDSFFPDLKIERVDSWNNIKRFVNIEDSFFIFDEQRVIGSGAWVKSFLKIVKNNDWILLTATPGDTWMDYIPVFVANGFYKNRTQFIKRHVIYNSFTKFPKVDFYREVERLEQLRKYITVEMDYESPIESEYKDIPVDYDKNKLQNIVIKKRWNPYTNEPLNNITTMIYIGRRVVNSDSSRFGATQHLIKKHLKLIIFYNFDYELEILRELNRYPDIAVAEYNGHKHEAIPSQNKWAYLVQYIAGSDAWNCVETNAILFYSLNYSYRIMTQAAGRIDRLNSPFSKLYYYRLVSNSFIDKMILQALSQKKNFNERNIWGEFNYEHASDSNKN